MKKIRKEKTPELDRHSNNTEDFEKYLNRLEIQNDVLKKIYVPLSDHNEIKEEISHKQ